MRLSNLGAFALGIALACLAAIPTHAQPVSTDRLYGVEAGLASKAPVRVATTAAITLSGLQSVDGVTLVANDRVLVKNQTNAASNGIYTAAVSAWIRALDWDGARDATDGTLIYVRAGSTNSGKMFRASATNPIAINVTSVAFLETLQTEGVNQFSYGAVCDGVTSDTTALQNWAASGKTLLLIKGTGKCIATGTLTMATNYQKLIGAGGQISWTSGISQAAAILASGDAVSIDHLWGENPNSLGAQTGERNYMVKFTGNGGSLTNSYGDKFQNCGWVDYTVSGSGYKMTGNTCDHMPGAGDGQSSGSSYGEDRGDAFYCGGSDCLIQGNTAYSSGDSRVAFHVENLYPAVSDHYGARIIGNHATGKFRRAAVCENPTTCEISNNTGQDMTWWDIACITTTGACGGTGNIFTYNRATTDNAGSAWSPVRAPLMIYGKTNNVSFNRSNQFNITGYANAGAVILGLNTGDTRAHTVNLSPQISMTDNGGYCVRAEFADGVTLDPVCNGFKDAGIKSYDVTGKSYKGYFNAVNKFNTKLILASITGTFTVGDTITQATSGAVGTLVYVDAANTLLTVSQTYAQSSTAFALTYSVSNAGSIGSGAVSRLNTYGKCIDDDNNAVGGLYDGAWCENTLTGKSIVNKTGVQSNNDHFKNVVTAYEGFGDTASTFGIGSVYETVTTKYSNTNGTGNTTGDHMARNANITDTTSVNVGTSSLAALTATGRSNVAVGVSALTTCTTCQQNVAIGSGAMQLTTTGASNTAVGLQALTAATVASGNVAVGFQSAVGATTGSQNTVVGSYALGVSGSAITGGNNTAIGYTAMGTATGAAADNTGTGFQALLGLTTGTKNTALGSVAGSLMTTGTGNIAIGYNAQVATTTGSNQLNIGNTITSAGIGSATPQVAIGNNVTGFTTGVVLDLGSNTSSIRLPLGTTAQRPTGVQGMVRYNTTTGTGVIEYHDGSAWSSVNANTTGTFTPTLLGSSTAGVTTYTTQLGRYTKNGDVVNIDIFLVWTGLTGTGNLALCGLPFAPSTTYTTAMNVHYSNLVVGAGKQLTADTDLSSSCINLLASDVAGGAAATVAVDTAGTLVVSGMYFSP